MLFVATLKRIPGTGGPEGVSRRMEWKPPEGVTPIAEYWPIGGDVQVVYIFEADSPAPIMGVLMEWADIFEFSVAPAVTAEEGLALGRQMMG